MAVAACKLPANSVLAAAMASGASFADSYCVPLTRGEASLIDVFFAIFGHHPIWLKALLLIRHRLGSWYGLSAAATSEILSPTRRANYRVGETIGSWPIYFLSDSELVAGRDNKHLDFRLSILKQAAGGNTIGVVSTVCWVHNSFGRLYLTAVIPFHKWGVRRLLLKAHQAGRL